MDVFAKRAAPIQVNYLGFPGTFGARYLDYIIADRHTIPETHKTFFTEKVVYLPHCYQANDRKKEIGTSAFTRAEFHLPERGFVFCCFNNNYKITPDVFDSWMRIFGHVKGSVFWLLEDNEIAARNLKKRSKGSKGVIDPDRLVFALWYGTP